MKSQPLISVCIPVFETEAYLSQCLRSVFMQDFDSFEIIVVNDASRGRDEKGHDAKKIVKLAQKECNKNRKEKGLSSINFTYIEHNENRGILEVRRTMVYEAGGKYIAMIDSDDEYIEGALKTLYEAAVKYDADIVHGTFVSGVYNQNNDFIPSDKTKCGLIFYGIKKKSELLDGWLCGEYAGNLCGKLFLRKNLETAFNFIPYTECNMAEDVLIFFFAAINSKRYLGIPAKVYRYRINSGMSSGRKIDSMKKWRLICSAASVFTVIYEWIKNNPGRLSEEEVNHIRRMTAGYLGNNLQQMKERVIPELQAEARALLCDFWGENLVCRAEKSCNI